jgi:hypothetical protein
MSLKAWLHKRSEVKGNCYTELLLYKFTMHLQQQHENNACLHLQQQQQEQI